MASVDLARVHAYISGRVQGVGYRMSCSFEAKKRALAGWVRNLEGGRVEALFEGPRARVEDMIEWCKRGPIAARVIDVTIEWLEAAGDLHSFRITH